MKIISSGIKILEEQNSKLKSNKNMEIINKKVKVIENIWKERYEKATTI